MESPLQQRLQARGRRVGGVEEVVDLLAGGPQLENWGAELGGAGIAEPGASSALRRRGLEQAGIGCSATGRGWGYRETRKSVSIKFGILFGPLSLY